MMTIFSEIRESFGTVRSVNIAFRGQRKHGSLYARLTDAVDTMEYLCGPAEQVDAAMSGPLGESPESLRALHGHLTINARFAENCCACIHVSDLGGTWARGVTILGDAGCVRLTDQVFGWWGLEGELVDSSELAEDGGGVVGPELLIVEEINRRLGQPTGGESAVIGEGGVKLIPPPNVMRTVAVCEAIRLSLRTGQSESPRKILELFELTR